MKFPFKRKPVLGPIASVHAANEPVTDQERANFHKALVNISAKFAEFGDPRHYAPELKQWESRWERDYAIAAYDEWQAFAWAHVPGVASHIQLDRTNG